MHTVEKENILEDVDVHQVAGTTLEQSILELIKTRERPVRRKPLANMAFRGYLRGDNTLDELVGSLGYEMFGDYTMGAEEIREALTSVLDKVEADESELIEDCPVCRSSMAAEIDKDLLGLGVGFEGTSYFLLHNRYGISQRVLMEHMKEHLMPEMHSYIDKARARQHAERV
jgi:hypothetical protein